MRAPSHHAAHALWASCLGALGAALALAEPATALVAVSFGACGAIVMERRRHLQSRRRLASLIEQSDDLIARSQARFESLVQHSSDLVVIVDDALVVRYVSPSVQRLLNYEPGTLAHKVLLDIVHIADRDTFVGAVGDLRGDAPSTIEVRLEDRWADWRFFELTLTDLRHEPAVAGVVVNGHDITQRKVLEGDLRHLAMHDELTGLGNRFILRDRVAQAIARPLEPGRAHALLFIDLDDFKTVNDGLGHASGDIFLQVTAQRIGLCLRTGDIAVRLGGDEFAVLLESITHADAEHVAGVMLESISRPFQLEDIEVTLTGSVGISYHERGADGTAELMLRNADAAMYYAKSRGKCRYEVFDQTMHAHALERLQLKSHLKGVSERGELCAYYQPIVELRTGAIVGFEALMRWMHPQRGLIPPMAFIPLAEESGEIVAMGRWLVEESLAQLASWQRHLPSTAPLGMSLNLSGYQLDDDAFVETLAELLERTGLAPADVTIELTESRPVVTAGAIERLRSITRLGVHLAADDFGSGEASYAALQTHPFTVVKVDRSLVQGLFSVAHDRAVAQLRSIGDLAREIGLRAIVEGIEDDQKRQTLLSLGFERGQGYHFGKPAPAEVATELLASSRRLRLSA